MKSQKAVMIGKSGSEDATLLDRFDRVLGETVEAMEEGGVRYVFIGGIASGGLGRPRTTHDIDLFVMPEEADLALKSLAKKGFKTERTDPTWLFKGFKEDILVDVIFKSKGEIYLDSEMYNRMITAEFHDRKLRLVSPEDLLIIKAAAHSELTPNHWHDAIALLSYANMDWQYLIRRARRAPRRLLSLLLYAQSNDIWVPNYVIHELYSGVFGNAASHEKTAPAGMPSRPAREEFIRMSEKSQQRTRSDASVKVVNQAYIIAHLRERLAEDPRTHELDIQIEQEENRIILKGEVPTLERREAVGKVAREFFPGAVVENQIRISEFGDPQGTEDLT